MHIFVPSPGLEQMRITLALRLIFDKPIPAPNPSLRISSVAVEKPSCTASLIFSIPFPLSFTTRCTEFGLQYAKKYPTVVYETTFISASYNTIATL